ncbi:MAG: lysophospholipid acyltransferase family protein [Thermodesulfovibrionales bacterium]
MRDLIVAAAFSVLALPLAVLPMGVAMKAGELLGLLAFGLWRSRRRIAVENIRAASAREPFGAAPEAIARRNFMHMGRSLAEVIKVYYGLGRGLVEAVDIRGEEHFSKAAARGKGVIFVTGHCGNWELMALAVASRVAPVGVVARPLDNPFLNRRLERVRQSYGGAVIYKKGALRNIISMLKAGGAVGILMDQSVLPEEGVLIDFLGRPAWTTRMPAALSRRTSSPVLPIFIRRTPRGHAVTIHPEVELSGDDERDTASLSSYVERHIRENPAEWLWIHRRWKRAPGPAAGR